MGGVESILQRYDIHYITKHKNIRTGFVAVDCPWCGSRGKYHLGISLARGLASCWACGPHSLADVLVALARVPLGEAIAAAGGVRRAPAPSRPVGRLTPPAGVGPLLPCHLDYLASRGLGAATAALWGLQGIGLAPRLKWRIYIPITLHGEVVSWTTRSIGNNPAKRYHGAEPGEEIVPAKTLLFGEDLCRNSIVVCEGPFDVFRIGPGATATLGVGYTASQLAKMAEYPVRVICMDSEPAAQKRARRLCNALAAFPGQTYNITLDAKDPGSASDQEVAEIRKYLE